ncbi:MAG: glycine--tRNA ligase [Methanobrevibacter sp.]|nr:glycine--tRNA ligase [Candidatus Methanovirga procula]
MNHDKMINIGRKRGFLWPSFEIYSGVAGFTDYGPLGAMLKNNVMQKWREIYIVNEGFYEIESPAVTPEEVLIASGHVGNFTDPMVQCLECKDVFRLDHIVEEKTNLSVDGYTNEELDSLVLERNVKCPNCESRLSEAWNFNLMFRTNIGPKGNKPGYMRPETAQGIFIMFKRLSRFFKNKLPFGVVQLGKAYRNEISPRQGVIRLREFTQAEAEIFVHPKDKTHPKFKEIANEVFVLYSAKSQSDGEEAITLTGQEALDNNIVANEILIYEIYLAKKFLNEIGIPDNVLRIRQHLPNEMAHYANDSWDVELKTDKYGWVEIIGIADRGDYDLSAHSKHSNEELSVYTEYDEPKIIKKMVVKPDMKEFGKKFRKDSVKIAEALKSVDGLKVKEELESSGVYEIAIDSHNFKIESGDLSFEELDEEVKGEKIIPHVIEPSFGIDRIIYGLLLHSFSSVTVKEDGKDKIKDYFKFTSDVSPIKVAVFPLVKKSRLPEIAIDIKDSLRLDGFTVEYDSSGTIGKRYARSDEIGIPLAVTVDFETLDDNCVTVRNRDSEKQGRVKIEELKSYIEGFFSN